MIQANALTKYYGDLCAVDHINFEVRKGEILGLLGPNGAGKTTVLRMLTGYLEPTEGTIHVGEHDIREATLAVKSQLGYLPESAPIYHDMLVLDYLTYIAGIRGIPKSGYRSRIRELVDICGLSEVMHQPVGEVSKGYKQRVGLAHAMMSDPEVLVLDEPTSGLDPNQIVEIRKIIRRIGREKTIIFSTHILAEAEATCDRILIISRGRIVADGDTAALKQDAGQERRIRITLQNATLPDVEAKLGGLPGIERVIPGDTDPAGLSFKLICRTDEDLRSVVYDKIKSTDWVLLEFHQEIRSLEHIFRELTREN